MSELERCVAQLLHTRKLAAGASDPETRTELVRRAAEQAELIRRLVARKCNDNR
jgi:hypothetical protein